MNAKAMKVLQYVSRGRGYVDVEPYPDSAAREALGELRSNEAVGKEVARLAKGMVEHAMRPLPIDKAPKDEWGILAYSPTFYQGKGGWVAACWVKGAWHSNPGAWRFEPTHWLPMPPSPSAPVRPPKPKGCEVECPPQQVCDHCQWPPSPSDKVQQEEKP